MCARLAAVLHHHGVFDASAVLGQPGGGITPFTWVLGSEVDLPVVELSMAGSIRSTSSVTRIKKTCAAGNGVNTRRGHQGSHRQCRCAADELGQQECAMSCVHSDR